MITYVFYLILTIGMIVLWQPQFKRKEKNSRIGQHMEQIFQALGEAHPEKKVLFFYGISVGVGTLMFFLTHRQFGLLPVLLLTAIFVMFPYVTLRIKLLSTQITGSYDGQTVIGEILNQYKICAFNIQEAIETSLSHLEQAPISRQQLFILSRQARTYRNSEELRGILDRFVYASGTEWSKMLSNNIYFALTEDVNVSTGLEDLLRSCQEAKKMLEQGKRANQEAFRIIKFLSPVIYLLMMWMLVYYMDFTIGEVIHYQLTGTGLMLFIAMILFAFVDFAVAAILTRPKFDL